MNMKEKRIDFNRDWTKREMQELIEQHCYLSFGKHEDLKALCINEEDFVPERRDWLGAVFIVPVTWLTDFCRKEFQVQDLDDFLQNEYMSDESELIFANALMERQVVMIVFTDLPEPPEPVQYEIRKADIKNCKEYSIWKHANEDVWEVCDEKFFSGIDSFILVDTRKVLEFDYQEKHFQIFVDPFSYSTFTKKEPFMDLGICNVVYYRFSERDFVNVNLLEENKN